MASENITAGQTKMAAFVTPNKSKERDSHDSMNNLATVGNFHIPNEIIQDDSKYVNVSYKSDNGSVIDHNLSDYMESHPIIRKIYSLLFNHDFRLLYEYAIEMNNIYPDLIEMENIEFGVKFQQVIFYGRDKSEYDSIYEKSLSINRQKVPSLCIRTRYKDSTDVFNDNHYEDYNINESVVLNSIFHNLLCQKLDNVQTSLQNDQPIVETIELLSSQSDDSDGNVNSDNQFDLSNSSDEDRGNVINSTAETDISNSLLPQINLEASIPDFYLPGINTDKPGEVLEQEFLKEDWMTVHLVDELIHFVPPAVDKTKSQEYNDKFLNDTFMKFCTHLFPLRRQFTNYRQLEQYLNLFLKSWKIRKNREGYSFKCFYAKSNRNYLAKERFGIRKQTSIKKLKSQIQCPFIIRWSCPGVKDKSLAPIFRKIFITHCNPRHTCGLCKESFRIATKMSKSGNKYDVNSLSNVLKMTKIDPCLPARHLRSLLETCLPSSISIDHDFLSNFRKRCQLYHAKNCNVSLLTTADAMRLTSGDKISTEESSVVESPEVINNIQSIYANIMQSGTSSWKALAFLRMMKSEEEGFDYRIHFNEEHVPDGIVWVTKEMKANLLRFGDVMFLDAQKRQYNKLCWPYIGPVIKTNENQTRCVAESIVITEDINMYKWILKTIEVMEPRWSLKDIKIIFADGLITNRLLHELNIADTCVLRGDYYHLMHEIFPKEHNFGREAFASIKAYVRCMLMCKTKEEWESSYKSAVMLLEAYPRKIELLTSIYNKPSYYAGYYLTNIPGNLNIHGTAAAESNHAAIVRHFGDSGAWNMVYHIKKLLERQQFYIKQDLLNSDRIFMASINHISDYDGSLSKHDESARKCLSHYAYTNLWIMVIRKSERLQFKTNSDNETTTVWPIGEVDQNRNSTVIHNGKRCVCHFRTTFLSPCPHEFCINTRFNVGDYSSRWLNNTTYNTQYSAENNDKENPNGVHEEIDVTSVEQNDDININDDLIELSQHPTPINVSILNDSHSKVQYSQLCDITSDLVRCVIHDKEKSSTVLHFLTTWVSRLRSKVDCYPTLKNVASTINKQFSDTNTETNCIENPLSAVTKCQSPNNCKKRLMSMSERNKIVSKKRVASIGLHDKINENSDTVLGTVIPINANKRRRCGICCEKGHHQYMCQKIKADYGKFPLPKNDDGARNNLAKLLVLVDPMCSSPLMVRQFNDQRIVANELPKKVNALIIHKRYYIKTFLDQTLDTVAPSDNICVECSIIKENYTVEDKQLFDPTVILRHIMKNKTNVIVNLL